MDKRERKRDDEIRPEIDHKALSLQRAMERAREIKIDERMTPGDILYFPVEKVPYGWTYKWIRVSVAGIPDAAHERAQRYYGWTPVPADRHPEEARGSFYANDASLYGNVIERKGLLLCEMPTESVKKIEVARNRLYKETTDSLRGAIEEMPHDPTVPTHVLENRDDFSVEFGRSFGN